MLAQLNTDPNVVDFKILFSSWKWVALVWLILEVLFYLTLKYYIHPKQSNVLSKPLPYPQEEVQFMLKVLDLIDSLQCYSMEKFMNYFFRGSDHREVGVGNMESFLAWAMFCKHYKDISDSEKAKVEHVLQVARKRFPAVRDTKPGNNDKLKHISMTLDPIPYIHFPLLSYVCFGLMEAVVNVFSFRLRGFQKLECGGLTYWFKRGSTASSRKPLVFFHGISPGWSAYCCFVHALASDRTMVLVDVDSIKIKSMSFYMPSPEQFSNSLGRILDRHRISTTHVVGHSFGSITAAWLLRHQAHRISQLTLIDPVSILLTLPDVAYNFLYKPPRTITEHIFHYIGSKEFTISHMLYRNFWWYNNALFLDDVPSHVRVVIGLSGSDQITNPTAQFEYISQCIARRMNLTNEVDDTKNNNNNNSNSSDSESTSAKAASIECVLWPGFSHGQILIPSAAQKQFIKLMNAD